MTGACGRCRRQVQAAGAGGRCRRQVQAAGAGGRCRRQVQAAGAGVAGTGGGQKIDFVFLPPAPAACSCFLPPAS